MTPFVTLLFALSALAVGVGRFMVLGHGLSWAGTYEAFAHIWVGVMGAVVYFRWGEREGYAALALLVILTVLETAMFLMR